ncbi:Hsp20 family protein [bacterium]|nr:Hsp20 family protein [bacterium]
MSEVIGQTEPRPVPQKTDLSWDPFAYMREMMRWDPFQELTSAPAAETRGALFPSFDVKETEEAFVLEADVPGVKEEDLRIELTGGRLSVSGKRESRQQHDGDRYYSVERAFGGFRRSFTLPEGADAQKITADLKDGVLTLSIPRKPGGKPRRIPVKAGR